MAESYAVLPDSGMPSEFRAPRLLKKKRTRITIATSATTPPTVPARTNKYHERWSVIRGGCQTDNRYAPPAMAPTLVFEPPAMAPRSVLEPPATVPTLVLEPPVLVPTLVLELPPPLVATVEGGFRDVLLPGVNWLGLELDELVLVGLVTGKVLGVGLGWVTSGSLPTACASVALNPGFCKYSLNKRRPISQCAYCSVQIRPMWDRHILRDGPGVPEQNDTAVLRQGK